MFKTSKMSLLLQPFYKRITLSNNKKLYVACRNTAPIAVNRGMLAQLDAVIVILAAFMSTLL